MPPVTESETQATLLEAWRDLPPESQRAVVSYALFLRHQEAATRIEEDEAAWDRLFSQPERMMHFEKWAQQALDQHPSEPLDESRL